MARRASGKGRSGGAKKKAPIHVLLAPCGFKRSLQVGELVDCMSSGVKAAAPDAEILHAPMVDGGEGFTTTLVELTGGTLKTVTVSGPLGRKVEAEIGLLGGAHQGEAAIEISAAAGLRLVSVAERDPVKTTSYGVGELIRHVLDLGASRLFVGCGDSGVSDGGVGLAEALGVRPLDREGRIIGRSGAALNDLAKIDVSGLDPRLKSMPIEVVVNWKNMLLGEHGVARVYGPQKGASPEGVALLERGLEKLAAIIHEEFGIDVAEMPGSGASGGLGCGMRVFLGAELVPRFEFASRFVGFEDLLKNSDLILTAEGSIDRNTTAGKMPAEIALRAKRLGIPVVAIVGRIGEGAEANLDIGVNAYFSILDGPSTSERAMEEAATLVAQTTEQAMRLFLAGRLSRDR